MFTDKRRCVAEINFLTSPFAEEEYIGHISGFVHGIDRSDRWIRSGLFIPTEYKDIISSYRLIGSMTSEGNSRIEALSVKLNIGVSLDEVEDNLVGFICSHLMQSGTDAAFAAFLPASGKEWTSCFIRSPRFSAAVIPDDIALYICSSALKSCLASSCGLGDRLLNSWFSDGGELFDDTLLASGARAVDKALRDITFCDIAVGGGQLISCMSSLIARRRAGLNRYLGMRAERSEDAFFRHALTHSMYATDCDAGAVAVLDICLRLFLSGQEANCGHILWGNVLTEDIFRGRLFDAVITNPPHIRRSGYEFMAPQLGGYESFVKNADIYCCYAERAFSLLKHGGSAELFISNKWMRAGYGSGLRKFLSRKNIKNIIDYGDTPVINGVNIPMSVIDATNDEARAELRVTKVDSPLSGISGDEASETVVVRSDALGEGIWTFEGNVDALVRHIAAIGTPLEEYTGNRVFRGILTGLNEAFVQKDVSTRADTGCGIIHSFLSGRDVKRYAIPRVRRLLTAVPCGFTDKQRNGAEPWEWFASEYPEEARRLLPYRQNAESRRDRGRYWWELRGFTHYNEMSAPKIICPTIVKRLSAVIDNAGLYSNDRTNIIPCADYYLLGVLNSKLMDFYFRHVTTELLNGFHELKPSDLALFPIILINTKNTLHAKLYSIVTDGAQRLSEFYAVPKSQRDDDSVEQAIKIERSVDDAVYRLYRLTRKEEKMVIDL